MTFPQLYRRFLVLSFLNKVMIGNLLHRMHQELTIVHNTVVSKSSHPKACHRRPVDQSNYHTVLCEMIAKTAKADQCESHSCSIQALLRPLITISSMRDFRRHTRQSRHNTLHSCHTYNQRSSHDQANQPMHRKRVAQLLQDHLINHPRPFK